jgi:hypothetical protein
MSDRETMDWDHPNAYGLYEAQQKDQEECIGITGVWKVVCVVQGRGCI